MDGLLIEVLGLRGCGRRQVPTCACRINLQLHSRPLSFTLTVVVALFLFATSLPSRPFTASRSFPALLSRVPLFFPFAIFRSDHYTAFCLSLSPSLILFFFSLFSSNTVYHLSSSLISRFQLLYLLLLKTHLFFRLPF